MNLLLQANFFFFVTVTAAYSGAPRIWQSGAKPGVWGRSPQASTGFYGFHIKIYSSSILFIKKGSVVPTVSAVSNRQHKNILVGLPKSLGMCKSRSLAKTNERRMQLI